MKKRTKAYVESLLEDFPNYEDHVARRKFELTHPYQEVDENVGGGKAQNKIVMPEALRQLITCEEDTRLNNLLRNHRIIKACYEDADPSVQIVVEELYFKPFKSQKYHTIQALITAGLIPYSRSEMYRRFDSFLETCASELGLSL